MRQFLRRGLWAAIALTAVGLSAGCSSSPNGGDGDETKYILWVTLERNLDLDIDVLAIQYLTADNGPTDGQVIVEGQVVSSFDSEGKATIIRQPPQTPSWDPGDLIHILALDSTGTVVHADSVVMPGLFHIVNVYPFNEHWRAGQQNPRFEWEMSLRAVSYVLSVQARNRHEALGYAEYHETQTGLTATLTPEVFYDAYDNLIDDYYDIHVIAYNPNFIPRNNSPYGLPEFPREQIPAPIVSEKVEGGISALLVSEHVTIEVAQ